MSFPDIIMVPVVELIRLEEHNSYGTFGVLRVNKSVFCITLEPPDRLNEAFKSSIPAQQYICRRHKSPKFGETFMVMNVPGRDSVLFHSGAEVRHTAGCIILAQFKAKLLNNRSVANSGDTFRAFMAMMVGVGFFHLTIFEHY